MRPAAQRVAVGAAAAGLLAAELSVASAYAARGTWWHYLLHQPIGWGLGLSVAALVVVTGRRVPPVAAAVAGQLVSIAPDLAFRYLRMPHTRSMDWFVGHIAVHRGPSPVLVALGVLLLGGWGWIAAAHGRRALGVALALAGPAMLLAACLLASPLPTRLSQY